MKALLQSVGIFGLVVLLVMALSPIAEMARKAIPEKVKAATTPVTTLLLPGLLIFTGSLSATLSNVTLDVSTSQNATGNLGLLTLTDSRGTGAGWSVTATASHFTHVGTPVVIQGLAGLLTGGTYTGSTSGTYTVTIVTPGILGIAAYTVSGLESQGLGVTGLGVALGTRGLTLTFPVGAYSAGDQWTVQVDAIPVTNLTITPSAVTTVLGLSTGVTAGTARTFTGTSDPATIMSATTGRGMGTYTNNPALSLTIPPDAKSGLYTGIVTETAN